MHRLAETMYEQSYLLQSVCWKYFIPQHIFMLCSVQISINEKWANQCIIQHTHTDVQLWRVLRVSFQHPVRIVDQNLQLYLLMELFKSCFIRENYIEKKVGVIVNFFHHEFAKFHTTIKTIFVQLLYHINFIWIKLDFFKILSIAMRLMSCC